MSAANSSYELIEGLKNLHRGPLLLPDVVKLGESAVPALEAILRGPSEAIYHSRCLAADALGAIGGIAIPALTRALRDSITRAPDPVLLEAESVVANRIAEHLGKHCTQEVTEALLEALRTRPYPACARALGRIGDPCAMPLLVECIYDDCARQAALEALRQFGREACTALATALAKPLLINGREAPSRIDGRAAAARLLGELEDENPLPEAKIALRAALNDRQRTVRLEAALSLARRAGSVSHETVGVLAMALDEPDWARADAIMQALARLGSAAEEILITLAAALPFDPGGRRRRMRAAALAGQLGTPSAVACLEVLWNDTDRRLRLTAVNALRRIADVRASSLAPYLRDEEAIIRRCAAVALRDRGALAFADATILLGDSDPLVRRVAFGALLYGGATAQAHLKQVLCTFGSPLRGLVPRTRLWWYALECLMALRLTAAHSRARRLHRP